MPECTEKRFQGLLHAYELGMLNPDERRELELHLLDCESCREELLQFQPVMRHLRKHREFRDAIGRMVFGTSVEEAGVARGRVRPDWIRRLIPTMIPASVVALMIIFLVVIKPWQLEIRPSQEAVASENRLAVMYFDNVIDPDDSLRLGEVLTNLLIADLAESRYMQVVSSQRLYDILKLLGKEGVKRIDGETATRVAEQAGAKWMLMGNILQVDPRVVVTAQLVEVATGNAVASQRVTGPPDGDIFSIVDRLTVEIKRDLALPLAAQEERDLPVADVTTHSQEAYRYFLEGVEYGQMMYLSEAQERLQKALRYDSAFAMAYYYLAIYGQTSLIDSALKYSTRASEKERFYIASFKAWTERDSDKAIAVLNELLVRYPDEKVAWHRIGGYYFNLGEYESAIHYFKKALEIDPLFKVAINMLAYAYNGIGDCDKALETIDMTVAIAPHEANPYDSRGELLARCGQLDEAIESYKQAIAIKPNFSSSNINLAVLEIVKRDYVEAEEYVRRAMASAADNHSVMNHLWALQAHIPQYQGKFDETIRLLDKAIAQDIDAAGKPTSTILRRMKSQVLVELGRLDSALTAAQEALDISRTYDRFTQSVCERQVVLVMALQGKYAQAERLNEKFFADRSSNDVTNSFYYFGRGFVELARRNYSAAIAHFKTSLDYREDSYMTHYFLGNAFLAAGRPTNAITEFTRILGYYNEWRTYYGYWSVKTYYYLGLLHEQVGEVELAIANFEEFLAIWENADPGRREIEDARTRLAHLRTVP